jgi:hypothetical protein
MPNIAHLIGECGGLVSVRGSPLVRVLRAIDVRRIRVPMVVW